MVLDRIVKKIMLFVAKATIFPFLFICLKCKIEKTEEYSTEDIRNSILYANHSSYLDPLLMLYAFPFNKLKFVLNKTVMDSNSFLRWVLTIAGCVTIDKIDFTISDLNSIIDAIDEKSTLVIFPEGYIHRNEPVNEFRTGLALLAYYLRLPVRPVYLDIPEKRFAKHAVIVGKKKTYSNIRNASKQVFEEMSRDARSQLLELKNNLEES